jgi:tetratricopeptide (TPR) repeat protein
MEFPDRGNVQIRASLSLVVLFYYAASALFPSPSTCNILGVLIASLGLPSDLANLTRGPGKEFAIAMSYYNQGLALDGSHAHLLTNLGSLLKDMGHTDEADRLYRKALEISNEYFIYCRCHVS